MKITKERLKKVIKEELKKVISESRRLMFIEPIDKYHLEATNSSLNTTFGLSDEEKEVMKDQLLELPEEDVLKRKVIKFPNGWKGYVYLPPEEEPIDYSKPKGYKKSFYSGKYRRPSIPSRR